jgi:AmiR/NasT family two-component response regulator
VRVIEQAKGILMAQNHCGPAEAFDLLRRASQRANIKVQVPAGRLIEQITSSQPLTRQGASCRCGDNHGLR